MFISCLFESQVFLEKGYPLGFVGEQHPVAQDVTCKELDILGRHEGATFHEGFRPAGEDEIDGGARRGASTQEGFETGVDLGRIARGIDEIHDVPTVFKQCLNN